MKAISLWQPWASAVVRAGKRFETRGYRTTHRGPLLIHAAKRCVRKELTFEGEADCAWRGALGINNSDDALYDVLPFGCLIGVADLVECVRVETVSAKELDYVRELVLEDATLTWTERMMGNFGPGRFAWRLERARLFPKPVPFSGKQGFFNVPHRLIEEQL